MSALNEGERRFAAYLDEYGYSWKHEPDYQAELGLAGSLETKPDFLVERGGHRTVAEVRQFETTALQDYLANSGRAGVMSPQQLFGPVRSANRIIERRKPPRGRLSSRPRSLRET